MPYCRNCGNDLEGYAFCTECGDRGIADSPRTQRPIHESGSTVVNRYRDAYRVGAALVGLGNAIKAVGAILGGIILLSSLIAGNSSLIAENGQFRGAAVVMGFFVAAIVGALFWVGGVIVAAQGQVLRATLDSAVAHSPFLTDRERLDAMGLP